MIVLDTAILLGLADRRDRNHARAVSWYESCRDELATTPLVLAELDHLAMSRSAKAATEAFRHDVAAGAYAVEWWPGAAGEAVEIAERYADLGLGLTDASLVALAARLETTLIATFDERHFRAVRPLAGNDAFVLLPADAP